MTGIYRLYGAEPSPYSVKVRSYLRYKAIPHEWIPRTADREEEFRRYAALPLVPVLVAPDETPMQDSTPIIEALEQLFPDPALDPADPALAFLSVLIEDYADEWANKPMFHYRWTYEADQEHAARWICSFSMPDMAAADRAPMEQMIRERMTGRLSFVGSNPGTLPIIEGSYKRLITILDAHLRARPFLFGARPAFADFGLYAQLYQLRSDPTPGAILRAEAPQVDGWIDRMLDLQAYGARATGPFEGWETLGPTLMPLLRSEVAGLYLPWMQANADAIASGAETLRVTLQGAPFEQQPQKYHAKALSVLKAKYAALGGVEALDAILDEAGCRAYLKD